MLHVLYGYTASKTEKLYSSSSKKYAFSLRAIIKRGFKPSAIGNHSLLRTCFNLADIIIVYLFGRSYLESTVLSDYIYVDNINEHLNGHLGQISILLAQDN